MSEPSPSNTGEKSKNGTGRFTKGDPRINRNGRPKNFDALRAVFLEIAHEEIKDKNGKTLTVIQAIGRKWAASGEPVLQKGFVEVAFGKVPDKIEVDQTTREIVVLRHAHEDFEPSRS